ncbi:MAG: hypothetical protein PHF63_02150 [Herbinix sp.]|nr:hypothetical protein [Herbinix sp.]
MRVAGKELFNLSEVNSGVAKFLERQEESEQKISQYENQLIEIDEQLNYAIEQDILSDGGNQKQVQNITAKKQNIVQMMETEKIKLVKIKELSAYNLRKAVPELYKQFQDDISYFQSTVEDDIFKRLFEVRQEQERLLLLLEKARSQADIEATKLNYIKNSASFADYEYKIYGASGVHNNAILPYRKHPEYGSPTLNIQNLKGIKVAIDRSYVEANNLIADKEKRVPKPTVSPEALQQFLDGLTE